MKGSDIKKIREKHGFSQADLAEIIGVKTGTITKWETGARNVGKSAQKLLEELETADVYDPNAQQKTPPGEARFEDFIANKVMEGLMPYIKDLDNKLETILEHINKYELDMDELKDNVEETKQEVLKRS